MIPEIGLVVCAYVFTRMLDVGTRKDTGIPARVCAAMTMFVTVAVALDLLFRGFTNLSLQEAITPIR